MTVQFINGQGTVANPFVDDHQLTIAEAFVEGEYKTPSGVRGLQFLNGEFWRWWNNKWEVVPETIIEDQLLEWSRNRYIRMGKEGAKKIDTWGGFLSHVMRGVKATTLSSIGRTPSWLRVDSRDTTRDLQWVIAFEDVCVDCKASAEKGEWVTFKRDERYFGGCIVPCKWDPGARCDRWMQALSQWGAGDPEWGRLLQREFGYSLSAFRNHRKWFLHYGIAVGGKSLIEKIRKALIGSKYHMSRSMVQLSKDFGLHPLSYAKVLCVTEVRDMEGKGQTEEISARIKSTVGQDSQMFDVKYRAEPMDCVSPALVVMLSNKIPKMSDTNMGLSSKMVMLPFYVSFSKNADPYLDVKLLAELPGIARWACEGAVEVVIKGEQGSWNPIESAEEDVEEFRESNNSADAFLKEFFIKSEDGYLTNDVVWECYRGWTNREGNGKNALNVTRFGRWIQDNNSWGVRRGRKFNQRRGFWGLAIKPIEVGGHHPEGVVVEEERYEEEE